MARNDALREYAKEKGVKMWQLAEALNIADSTLCRRLRKELSQAELSRYMIAVDHLAVTMDNANGKQ